MKKIITITLIILVTVSMQSCKTTPIVTGTMTTDTGAVGKKDTVLNKVIAFYGNDFDFLAKKTTLDSLEQDKNTLAQYHNDSITNKIKDLEKYLKAKLPLTLKYNETEITKAVSSLQTINKKSQEVENLITLLENYVYARQHLIEIIQQFNTVKISRIQAEIENEIYKNDGVNSETYPYLYDICRCIMNREELNQEKLLEDI
jgi:phenylalanyl-tRNA synthetase alpha subunit